MESNRKLAQDSEKEFKLASVTDHAHARELLDMHRKYERILDEVMSQLYVVIEGKSEDIDRLMSIRKRVRNLGKCLQRIETSHDRGTKKADADILQIDNGAASETSAIHRELRSLEVFVQASVQTLEDAMMVESRFMDSTRALLQDIIAAAIDFFNQLSRLHEYDESIVATVREPLLVLDENLRVVSASRSYYASFAVGPEQTVGHYFCRLCDNQWDDPLLKEKMWRVIHGNEDFADFEMDREFHGLGHRTLLFSGRRLVKKSGSNRLMLLTFEDVTARKKSERELLRSMEESARYNAALRKKNEELDEFTYVASHDLQEPLRKLISFSELLKIELEERLSGKAIKYLDYIADAAGRMHTLVQDLLLLSRSGRTVLHIDRFPLDKCVEAALHMLDQRVRETGARIQRDPLGEIRGDRLLLTQLFQNLISNAMKFCDRPPTIQIFVDQHRGEAVYGVKDNGIGIKPSYAQQIFMPFKRLHGRGKYEGSGIGLSICRKAVERHNGRIWVESEPGAGATFKFTLGRVEETGDE